MKNSFAIFGDAAFIYMTHKGKRMYAMVDVDDLPKTQAISGTWSIAKHQRTHYVVTQIKGQGIRLHRWLLDVPTELEVDHIDRNGLNNRRANLRFATRAQNAQNRPIHSNNKSGYRGVSWNRELGMWIAQVCVNGENRVAGWSPSRQEAGEIAAEARSRLMPFSQEALH